MEAPRLEIVAYTAIGMDLSSGGLFLSLFIGSVGTVFLIYGKKQSRVPQIVAGILLIAYPYFVSNLWVMGGIAVAIVAAVWGAVKMGY